jgi:hypothetical protein
MALGFFSRKDSSTTNPIEDRNGSHDDDKKDAKMDPADPEKQQQDGNAPNPRRKSRVERSMEAAETDSGVGIGAQVEMEKDNAIKYRTCSWQKVPLPAPLVANHALFDSNHTLVFFETFSLHSDVSQWECDRGSI